MCECKRIRLYATILLLWVYSLCRITQYLFSVLKMYCQEKKSIVSLYSFLMLISSLKELQKYPNMNGIVSI